MQNKIFFTGAHGTGKTTIIELLEKDPLFKDYKIITGINRSLNLQGLPISENSTDYTQLIIFNENLKYFILNDKLISDRSLVDNLAYSEFLYDNHLIDKELIIYCNKLFERYFKYYKEKYFYFPIEFELIEDGIRPRTVKFQKIFDNYLLKKLEKFNINYITVKGTIKERIDIIMKNLD